VQDFRAKGDETLCRVLAILMPLQTKRDLCLALSAEANDLVQVLIRLHIRSICNRRQDHLVPLLQNGARLNLVHEAAFAFERITHLTSHISFYCRLFWDAVNGWSSKTLRQQQFDYWLLTRHGKRRT
jgi:hypothetical protein